jgi:hypothetical protein
MSRRYSNTKNSQSASPQPKPIRYTSPPPKPRPYLAHQRRSSSSVSTQNTPVLPQALLQFPRSPCPANHAPNIVNANLQSMEIWCMPDGVADKLASLGNDIEIAVKEVQHAGATVITALKRAEDCKKAIEAIKEEHQSAAEAMSTEQEHESHYGVTTVSDSHDLDIDTENARAGLSRVLPHTPPSLSRTPSLTHQSTPAANTCPSTPPISPLHLPSRNLSMDLHQRFSQFQLDTEGDYGTKDPDDNTIVQNQATDASTLDLRTLTKKSMRKDSVNQPIKEAFPRFARANAYVPPTTPLHSYYLAELAHLRTESLPQLRHAARKLDGIIRLTEHRHHHNDAQSAETFTDKTKDDFMKWWSIKKPLINELATNVDGLVKAEEENGMGSPVLGWGVA